MNEENIHSSLAIETKQSMVLMIVVDDIGEFD